MSRYRPDEELPPLPAGLEGLRGMALVRAAYEATRPGREAPRPRQRPFAVSKAPAPAEPVWTPHSAAEALPALTPGHWADGTPIPESDTPEEDR